MANISIVDENDEPIGAVPIEEALRQNAIRRISRVFLFDDDGRMFLQKRSSEARAFPDRWDQSAGGHVDEGESYDQAARRELFEEIGVSPGISMGEACKFFVIEDTDDGNTIRSWNTVFAAQYDGTPMRLQRSEVSEGKWCTIVDIDTLVAKDATSFTPGFLAAWAAYKKTLT